MPNVLIVIITSQRLKYLAFYSYIKTDAFKNAKVFPRVYLCNIITFGFLTFSYSQPSHNKNLYVALMLAITGPLVIPLSQ